MGIDVRVWIGKESLKKLDIWDFNRIYENFSGRWHHCITNRFEIERDKSILTLKEIREHLAYNSKVGQEARDIISSLDDLDLIFQTDCETKEPEGYFELFWFVRKALKEKQEKII